MTSLTPFSSESEKPQRPENTQDIITIFRARPLLVRSIFSTNSRNERGRRDNDRSIFQIKLLKLAAERLNLVHEFHTPSSLLKLKFHPTHLQSASQRSALCQVRKALATEQELRSIHPHKLSPSLNWVGQWT